MAVETFCVASRRGGGCLSAAHPPRAPHPPALRSPPAPTRYLTCAPAPRIHARPPPDEPEVVAPLAESLAAVLIEPPAEENFMLRGGAVVGRGIDWCWGNVIGVRA